MVLCLLLCPLQAGLEPTSCDCDSDTYSVDAGDCAPYNAAVNPGATEACNDIDDDCDSLVDDADNPVSGRPTWYADSDTDTYGNAGSTTLACDMPSGYVANDDDCDDVNAAINPASSEVAGNNVDENCNGQAVCYTDGDNDGARLTSTVNSSDTDCLDANEGLTGDALDCDDADAANFPGNDEICDEQDNDCDMLVDDDDDPLTDPPPWYLDADNDSYGDEETFELQCLQPDPDYTLVGGDCDDGNENVSPAANEVVCDGKDNDCDPETSDDPDGDEDGVGLCSDCDDDDPDNYPGNAEVCDSQDNDCDNVVDEGCL